MKCLSLKWIICILHFLFTLIFWCNYCLRRLVWKCSIIHLRAFILKYYTQVRLKYIFSNSHLMCCTNNYFMWPFRENIFCDCYSHPIKIKKPAYKILHIPFKTFLNDKLKSCSCCPIGWCQSQTPPACNWMVYEVL